MTEPVPFLDLTAQFRTLEAEWLAAIRETGAKGSFILGPNVTAFERDLAEYVGVKHAIGVANGTDSLTLSLRALGIRPGDEVITTPYTFFASSEAVDVVGATPVFADVDPATFTLDPESVAERVTERTRAIIPVHIFGHPCDMAALTEVARRHELVVIEDCAQAFGATVGGKVVGSLGDTGSFSFYPTKVLGCYGDGGMVTTNSDAVNERVRRLRNHGAVKPFTHVEVGCNSRLDEIQAALLRLKLRNVRADLDGRRRVARAYDRLLSGTPVTTPKTAAGTEHAYNLYTVRLPKRDAVRQALTDAGIQTALCYPQGLHLQEVYKHLQYRASSLPVCERLTEENLSLPIYPGMPEKHIERVCAVLEQAVSQP